MPTAVLTQATTPPEPPFQLKLATKSLFHVLPRGHRRLLRRQAGHPRLRARRASLKLPTARPGISHSILPGIVHHQDRLRPGLFGRKGM